MASVIGLILLVIVVYYVFMTGMVLQMLSSHTNYFSVYAEYVAAEE